MATTRYYATSGSEKLEEIDEEEQLMWQSEHQQRNTYNHDDDEDDNDDDDEDDELMIEDASSMSSSPSIPDENINFDLVYALHTFVATVEGQASVVKGDALILMEDTNIYWWLVEVLKTREVGYIPAENIETPYERLARLNKHRNVEITSPSMHDIAPLPLIATHPLHATRRVTIGDEALSQVFHYEVESELEDEDEECFEQEHLTDEEDEEEMQVEEEQIYQVRNEFQEIKYDNITEKQDWQEKIWDEEEKVDLEAVMMEEDRMDLRIFAGNIGQGPLFHTFPVLVSTAADDLIKIAVNKFCMMDNIESSEDTTIEYYLAVQGMDGDEYVLSPQDKPYSIFKTLTDSLTTPMPSLSHIRRISQQSLSSTSSRRPRSSSFSNYEQTSYDEDSVIRIYLHRRIKRAVEREGMLYIKVSLYPDESTMVNTTATTPVSNSAFTKNPTTPNLKLTKKRQQQQKSEIDRIDKIISVKKDYQIGVVINLALEKFHVPDAQADDYICGGDSSRQLGKYRMSLRSNNKETELNPNELMSNVLLNSTTTTVTSDLLFVLRKAGSLNKQSQRQRHSPKGSTTNDYNKVLPSQLSTSIEEDRVASEDRRPSILDILMDTPKFMGERRPSVMSSLLDPLPPPRFAEENNNRRPSSSTINQERKSSLNNNNGQSPSSSSSLSFPIIEENMDNIVEVTPTSSSSIMTKSTQLSSSTEVTKKKESLKQQFKRFVGWGSSSTTKKPNSNMIPPPLTTNINSYNNVLDSPSDMSFVSAPSTPLPPTPGTPRSFTSKSRQGSQQLHGESKLIMEVNTPTSMSRRPSETTTLNDPSAASLAVASVVTTSNNKRLSTVSSVSSSSSTSSTSSVTSEEIAVAAKKGVTLEESDDSDNEIDKNKKQVVVTEVDTSTAEDIQAQYAMWMNSQPVTTAVEIVTAPATPTPVLNSAIMNKALPPVITSPVPARNPLRNKASNISNTTTITATPSPCNTPSIISTTKEERSLHPMPSNNGQDLDDLFLLVAHGVDFLTTRENTKWEEEGGYEFHPWNRPQSSFAVRQQVQRSRKEMPPLPISTTSSTSHNTNNNNNNTTTTTNTTTTNDNEENDENTSAALAMARSLLLTPSINTNEDNEEAKPISPPLTPLPQQAAIEEESPLSMAKRILGAKHEIPVVAITPSVQLQPQQSVDDEELQRIVASHIVF